MKTFFKKICLLIALLAVYVLVRGEAKDTATGNFSDIINVTRADHPYYDDTPIGTDSGCSCCTAA